MKNLKTISFLIFLVTANLATAQLDPQYTQYHFNQYLINPAFGGLYESTAISFNSRAQWYGMEGAPFTNTLTLESSLTDHSGIGIKAMNDRNWGSQQHRDHGFSILFYQLPFCEDRYGAAGWSHECIK